MRAIRGCLLVCCHGVPALESESGAGAGAGMWEVGVGTWEWAG